jgi:hypothetical protein
MQACPESNMVSAARNHELFNILKILHVARLESPRIVQDKSWVLGRVNWGLDVALPVVRT